MLRLACFWPGLVQLWLRGSWVGLTVAVGFTALLNVMILATLVYDEWLPRRERLAGGVALLVVWTGSWLASRTELRRQPCDLEGMTTEDEDLSDEDRVRLEEVAFQEQEREQLYRAAQRHYLHGDWVATERALHQLLKQDPRDAEARLMLATLWRHQGRASEALRQLNKLERLEAGARWHYEIAAERTRIERTLGAADDVAPSEVEDAAEDIKQDNTFDSRDETDGRLAA